MRIRLPSSEAIFLSGLLALLAALSSWLNTPQALNNIIHDSFQRTALGQAPEDILIVGIDEASLQGIGKWPWRRDIHAQLIDRLAAARVKAIAYDIVFSERDTPNPEYDAKLVQSVRNFGRVVLPVFVGENKPGGQLLEIIPFDELAEAAHLAHAHIEIDEDGQLRSTHLKEGLGSAYWEHMTVTLHRLAYNSVPEPLPGLRSPDVDNQENASLIVRDYRTQIRFSARPAGFRMLSFIDVLDGRYPASELQGKIIFVGTMAAGLSDTLATPVSSENRHMQGVELNANIFAALRSGTLITPLTALQKITVTGVAAFLCLLVITSAAPAISLLMTIGLTFFLAATSFVLLAYNNIWWPPAACCIAVSIGYPLWSWRRLERSMGYLREEMLSLGQEGRLLDHELLDDAGSTPWQEASASVPKRNIDVVAFHINQIRNSHANRRRLRHFIFSCLANLSDGVVATSSNGRVVLINDQARQLLLPGGEAAHEMDFRALLESNLNTEMAANQLAALAKAIDGVYQSGEETEFEFLSKTDNEILLQGNEFALSEDSDTADEDDKIVVFTLTDITRIREMERTRAETLNFVSHDLRSPLVSILALIERSRGQSDELMDIRSYAQRALSYTESFLQLARAEADNISFYECDLHSVADNASEYVYTLAARRRIRIESTHCDEDVWIWGNGDLLERMIINLLDNAIKYSAEGSVVKLHLTTDSNNSTAILTVSDSGIGIPEEDLPHLFEQFRRGSSEESRTRKGAGLGLRFIAVTAQRHSGSVQVKSRIGEGSEFSVRLPLFILDSETE
ncbi:MAG: CHASE2 domain-containing protein [Pseudomonadales bacterium]